MLKSSWVKSFFSGLGFFGPKRRSSVWQKQPSQTQELQTLESRLLMSSVSLSADPGGARTSPFVPTEDLYDEGAGAVWGGLMDPLGGQRSPTLFPPFSTGGNFGPGDPDGKPEGDPGVDVGGGYGGGFGVCGTGTDGGGSTGGSSVGGGSVGGGPGNLPEEELELFCIDADALEGPYRVSKLDEAEWYIRRVGFSPQRTVTAQLKLSGTATHQTDYRLSTEGRPINPWRNGDSLYASVTIPAGVKTVPIVLTTLMDGDWEEPERMVMELVKSADGSSRPGNLWHSEVEIKDATADLRMESMHAKGSLLQSPAEDRPGAMLRVNNDYDNGRDIPDHVWYDTSSRAFLNEENDVMRLWLKSYLEPTHDLIFESGPEWFQLQYDTSALRIYKRPRPSDTSGWLLIDPSTQLYLADGQSWEFAVEGLSAAHGQIGVRWGGFVMNFPSPTFDQVTATTWDVDLDIDSDNTNGYAAPDRSNWEEYIEDHSHGIGKLLFVPQGLPTPGQKPTLTAAAFSIAPQVYERGVRFDFPGPQGDSGFIQVWSHPADVPGGLIQKPVEEGGHQITSGYTYTDKQVAEFKGLWIEPVVAQRAHNTLAGVENKQPNDRIRMTASVRTAANQPWMPLSTDEVRYVVNETADTFYPNLQFDRSRYWDRNDIMSGVVLRDALISEAVYDVKDLPKFGQQLLNEQQLWDLGLPSKVVLAIKCILEDPEQSGLKLLIYRDFLSPQGTGYVLAFAGTDPDASDVVNDILQGLGSDGPDWLKYAGILKQYPVAMRVGYEFGTALRNVGLSPRTTGHSLGGGLASAASIAANKSAMPANTFNAAGLHVNTVTYRDDKGYLVPGVPKFDGAIDQFKIEQGNTGRIKAFYVEFDALTYLQNNLPAVPVIGAIPRAAGMPVKLIGAFNSSMKVREKGIISAMNDFPTSLDGLKFLIWLNKYKFWLKDLCTTNASFFTDAASLHRMRSVLYGLLVERSLVNGVYRGRKIDLFGYKVSED